MMIALDRQERGQGERSAVQEVEDSMGVKVVSIIGLADLVTHLESSTGHAKELAAVAAYRGNPAYACGAAGSRTARRPRVDGGRSREAAPVYR